MRYIPGTSTDVILETVHDGGALKQHLREWETMDVDEFATKARAVVYGIVTPHLADGEPASREAIEEVQALFEACFKRIDQGTRSRSSSPR